MRKYQKKLVNDLAGIYQSNDPLKWTYIAHKLGVNRPMNAREFRIFKKRLLRTFKKMGIAVSDAVQNMVGALTKAASSMADMVAAMKRQPSPLGGISIGSMPEVDISKQMIDHSLYNRRVLMGEPIMGIGKIDPPILGNMPDLKISIDEYDGSDDERK